ncbi:sensor histidine kinase [Roseinatronobacter alkalisoli]|uniref:histidine kinase n=1 Tax=Roseinatronobacter alkalisoli TaxID=3028235 RepID=A0ABT5TB82_9RHOB|nr:histidine kinase dimerization/phosphoacceptor domain -containing protein [Roseinatronobacter sp. HJB301]MDD7972246.1 histidine kinase dimerization/phosphoacceptor domain -containing protein [Roseinatronobacter sp. HJB301]
MNGLSATLIAQRSWQFELVFGASAVIVATFLRFALDNVLPPGFPFLTFFPAVMLALFFASIRCGIAVVGICGVIAWYWFIAPVGAFSLNSGVILALGFYVLITATNVLIIAAAVRALRELSLSRRKADELAQSRTLMFSELQHRVSNNLGTIAALLRLQTAQTSDAEARRALAASEARITSISRLQRRLHSVDAQSVNVAEYLRDVLQDTLAVAKEGTPVALTINAAPLRVLNNAAVPLGLIASELMMNSIKHGTSHDGKTVIEVSLTAEPADNEGRIAAVLEMRDNGPGLPTGFELAKSSSLGLTVATQFAKALDGELSLCHADSSSGTLARLRFTVPDSDPAESPLTNAGSPAKEQGVTQQIA